MFGIGGCGAMSKERRAWTAMAESWTVVRCMMSSTGSCRGLPAWTRILPWMRRCGFGSTRDW